MKYFLAIALSSILYSATVVAQVDSSAVGENPTNVTEVPQDRNRPPHVFDLAGLLNPTLIDKFEQKLDSYEIINRIAVRLVTVANRDSVFVDRNKSEYLRKSNDVLILLIPRIDSLKGEAFILTEYESDVMLPQDVRRSIVNRVDSAWLSENFYETGAIIAVDNVLEEIDKYIESQKDPMDFVYIGIGLLALAVVLYLFSTVSFKKPKENTETQ